MSFTGQEQIFGKHFIVDPYQPVHGLLSMEGISLAGRRAAKTTGVFVKGFLSTEVALARR